MLIRVCITIAALAAIIVHAIFPSVKLDAVTIGFLVVAVLPWLSKAVESFELPGGWKLKFRDLEKTAERAEKMGLIIPALAGKKTAVYTFELVGDSDPNLALAGLRIEMEKRLKTLAEMKGIGTRMQGAARLLQMLAQRGIIGDAERDVLIDMVNLLNAAVHGAKIDLRAYDWAMRYGPGLLRAFDKRIEKNKTIRGASRKR